MPGNITDEEKLPKIPNLDAAQWKFYLKQHPGCGVTEAKLLDEVKAKDMAPFYAELCEELGLLKNNLFFKNLIKAKQSTKNCSTS